MTQPVVIGSASRDLTSEDPRGWRLGGAAAYAGLTLARLGLRPRVLLGVDADAAGADELEWVRRAGGELRLVPLASGPVFENRERPDGREQVSAGPGDRIAPVLPAGWEDAPAWLLVPVADELPDAWSRIIPPGAVVGVGWQGLLRTLPPGGIVRRRPPARHAILDRATIVVVSRMDLAPGDDLASLEACLPPAATLFVTDGEHGGVEIELQPGTTPRLRQYPAIPADRTVDPTGAGDVFLAALVAARLGHPLAGSGRRGTALRFAAAAGSLAVEAPGLAGVPDARAIAYRIRRSLGLRQPG